MKHCLVLLYNYKSKLHTLRHSSRSLLIEAAVLPRSLQRCCFKNAFCGLTRIVSSSGLSSERTCLTSFTCELSSTVSLTSIRVKSSSHRNNGNGERYSWLAFPPLKEHLVVKNIRRVVFVTFPRHNYFAYHI